ncbi:MAG: GNAT family N-acetyltransferase [Candidatus Thorarchaeota archaeon]
MPDIIRARANDFVSLCEIYSKEYGSLTEARIRSYLEYNHILLLQENAKIIGGLFWFAREAPRHGLAEIEDFFVAEEHRGKGYGSMLLASAIDYIKHYFEALGYKARRIIVFTGKKNTIARSCYEKHGFSVIAEVGDLFDDNNPEIMYGLKLSR